MIRRVIQIDEEKCNGCGACAKACHEGAIGMVNGKAKLMRDDYCDGLGDCLPACPTNAISFVEREAAAYDEKAVEENKKRLGKPVFHGCPGSMMKTFAKKPAPVDTPSAKTPSQLMQWPVQIKLVPVNAPYCGRNQPLSAEVPRRYPGIHARVADADSAQQLEGFRAEQQARRIRQENIGPARHRRHDDRNQDVAA